MTSIEWPSNDMTIVIHPITVNHLLPCRPCPIRQARTTRSVSTRYVFRHHSHIPRIITPDITLTYLNSPLLPQIALSTPLMTAWVTDHHMMHSSPREEPSQPEQPKGETFSRAKSLGRQNEVVMIPELVIVSTNWL